MYDDPGWGVLTKRWWLLLIPGVSVIEMRRRSAETNGLTRIRLIWLNLEVALWLYALVLLFIVSGDRRWSTDQSSWMFWVVLIVGLLSTLMVRQVRSRPLRTTSPEKLASSFMAMMFIGIGNAETAALVAFVATFIMSTYWIYFVGLSFSAINLLLVGPTRREIARRQEQTTAQGSPLSLGAALMAMPGRSKG